MAAPVAGAIASTWAGPARARRISERGTSTRQLFRALGALTVSVAAAGADGITAVRLENDSGSVKVNGTVRNG
ncbi:hypothetical protein ACWG43_12505 [Streptomyces albidoflavus]